MCDWQGVSNLLIERPAFNVFRYDSGDVWHTTPIAERVDECPIKLRTASGSLYTLDDEIDKRSMQKNSMY